METPPTNKVHWLNLRYTDQQCPGMHEIFGMAPKDQQSALVRGILYQWCLEHRNAGTLTQAIIAALNGPGVKGKRGLRHSTTKRSPVSQAPALVQAVAPDHGNARVQELAHAASPLHTTPPFAMARVAAPALIPVLAPSPNPDAQKAPAPAPEDEPRTAQADLPPAAGTAADALFDMFDD